MSLLGLRRAMSDVALGCDADAWAVFFVIKQACQHREDSSSCEGPMKDQHYVPFVSFNRRVRDGSRRLASHCSQSLVLSVVVSLHELLVVREQQRTSHRLLCDNINTVKLKKEVYYFLFWLPSNDGECMQKKPRTQDRPKIDPSPVVLCKRVYRLRSFSVYGGDATSDCRHEKDTKKFPRNLWLSSKRQNKEKQHLGAWRHCYGTSFGLVVPTGWTHNNSLAMRRL